MSKKTPHQNPNFLRKTALRLGKLLLKQTAAALVCSGILLGMHYADMPRLNAYTTALGNALRYETDLSFLQDALQWFQELLPNRTEGSNT